MKDSDPNRSINRRASTTTRSRRKLLKAIAAGGGTVLAAKQLPETWIRPTAQSVVLPAHAQTTPGELGDFLIEGTYKGTQEAAGPFVSENGLIAVQFPEQPVEIVVTSSQIIYKVAGEEAVIPHNKKTYKLGEDNTLVTSLTGDNDNMLLHAFASIIPSARANDTVTVETTVNGSTETNRLLTVDESKEECLERCLRGYRFLYTILKAEGFEVEEETDRFRVTVDAAEVKARVRCNVECGVDRIDTELEAIGELLRRAR